MFNIITTNKNKTATAPTYTIKSSIAKNSAPIKTKRPVALKNVRIRKKTECTGFLVIITIIEEITAIIANI